jgi:hypothetical protein
MDAITLDQFADLVRAEFPGCRVLAVENDFLNPDDLAVRIRLKGTGRDSDPFVFAHFPPSQLDTPAGVEELMGEIRATARDAIEGVGERYLPWTP